jgi:hypothetical protein
MNKEMRGTQGQAILQLFQMDLKTKFDQTFIQDTLRSNYLTLTESEMNEIISAFSKAGGKEVPLSVLLDLVIPFIHESDFVLKKRYVIKDSVQTAFGKWPQTYGNAFFTDSKFLLQDLMKALQENMI